MRRCPLLQRPVDLVSVAAELVVQVFGERRLD